MFVNEVNWTIEELNDDQTLTWSRKDYGTSRLMLPGPEGPPMEFMYATPYPGPGHGDDHRGQAGE